MNNLLRSATASLGNGKLELLRGIIFNCIALIDNESGYHDLLNNVYFPYLIIYWSHDY